MKLSKKTNNIIKLVNKIIPKNPRTKSAHVSRSKSHFYKYSRPQTAINSRIIKRNPLNRPKSSNYINKSCSNDTNLNLLNLMIENNPLQYNYKKIKEKAKQVNPIFNVSNLKNLSTNTQKVLYRYNILYGNNTPNLIRTYSPKMRPMSSSVKVFLKTIRESEEDKEILNEKEILFLIEAKCKDIGIDFRESMYIKFKDFCGSKCKNRVADFSECYFGLNSIKVISDILLITNRISRLNLTKNNIGDEGVEILVKAVKNSMSLVSLNVTSNSISYKGGLIIFNEFYNQQSIIDLNISSIEGSHRNRITSVGLKNIINYLKRNFFIEILNLSGNSIRNEGFFLLCKGLKNNISLQNLDISNNDIHEKGIKKGIEYINISKIYSKIHTINISYNPILNGGIIAITNNLRYFPYLKSINISYCGIEFKGFDYLLKIGQYIKRFEYLNVSGNKLRDDMNFSNLKQYFCTFNLRYLNMAKCSLGDKSAFILGECIAVNETLKTINISGNEIGDKGFKSFVKLFLTNNSIENFDCSNNFITDYSGKELTQNLLNNHSLKCLNLYDNQLHDEIGNLFIEILDINKTLVHINLNYNRIQVKTIEDLNKILKNNYDKQKNSFVPDLMRNIKDLEFQPEQFSILSKKILEKKNLQNFLYKKVQQDNKNFCLLLNEENKKLEKEKKKLNELIKEKKEYEKKIFEINRSMDNNDNERRIKEEEIKDKIEEESKNLKEINKENKIILKEYSMDKNELLETFSRTEKKHKLSQDKYFYAKIYYDTKDKEYIEKFSYYQDLINPNLLVPIKKPIINSDKNKKYLSNSVGNILKNDIDDKINILNKDNGNNRVNDNFRKVEEYKINEKNVKIKMRNNSKKIPVKKLINKNNSTNVVSTSTTISTGNINVNTDEKILNATFNRTFKFNKTKNK